VNENRKIKLIVFQERDRKEVTMKKLNMYTKEKFSMRFANYEDTTYIYEDVNIFHAVNAIKACPQVYIIKVEGVELPPIDFTLERFRKMTNKQFVAVLNSYIDKLISLGY
jgi:hypothetical protein